MKVWASQESLDGTGIDPSDLTMDEEFQIRSRQDWERGLRGEIDGNRRCGAEISIATKRADEGMETAPERAVCSVGRSEPRDSDIDPCKFRMELTQQSGSEAEFTGSVLPLAGQQACARRWVGWQIALNPESCTRKTASRI